MKFTGPESAVDLKVEENGDAFGLVRRLLVQPDE